ncbi:hypothetical protein PQD71_gp192 [Kosakonia phage Kc263]|uniref:Uncharacterized protein n=1 Tax=Kosakonia phage Kc263 TaxID=2863194 RepID=A0AAE7WI65_9CAUD|nr:hypothetical protein PQD71_gp192 [Kosakonia phage Kc263]QYN80134.1 hypothetical protein [Kosakonia phage Kc263]
MFKLLLETNSHVGYTRKLPQALQDHKAEWEKTVDKNHAITVYLTHTLVVGNHEQAFSVAGQVDLKINKKVDDRPVPVNNVVTVLEEGKNYNFAPLNEVIFEAVQEAISYTDMTLMFEDAEPLTDADIIEKIKHVIKTELENRKVFATFAITPQVSKGNIRQVTLVVSV